RAHESGAVTRIYLLTIGLGPLSPEIDEWKAGFSVMSAPEVEWRFHQHDFQRRPHMCLEQMSAVCGAIGFPDHNVGVHLWLPVDNGNVAGEREHLALLVEGDPLVAFSFLVEVAEYDVTTCSATSEEAVYQTTLLAEC